jgi:hypothetical protein
MTFLYQMQLLLERTYAATGINLEECLVGRQRYSELCHLAGPLTREFGPEGCTFLRLVDGRLHVAIYYHPAVVRALEEYHPLKELSRQNIRPLIVFLEEINHAVHATLLFMENRLQMDSEDLLCDLELQAKIDTYLVLELLGRVLRRRKPVTARCQKWFQQCLFEAEGFDYESPNLRTRYSEANRLGLKFVRHLDRLKNPNRVELIRRFRSWSFQEKRQWIDSLK